MEKVRDRIAKLLALAESSNENEAKLALLRAQELMANHKLSLNEVQRLEDQKVVEVVFANMPYTTLTDVWVSTLRDVIAEHYCCGAFVSVRRGKKKRRPGFIGFETDIEIVKLIFPYAYDCVKVGCAKIVQEQKGMPGRLIRQMCNAYGMGFCEGLRQAYQEQEQQHKEWALVLQIPQLVLDKLNQLDLPSPILVPEITRTLQSFWLDGISVKVAKKGH